MDILIGTERLYNGIYTRWTKKHSEKSTLDKKTLEKNMLDKKTVDKNTVDKKKQWTKTW